MKNLSLKIIVASALIITTQGMAASNAEELLKTNGCMACHNIMGKKAAPAFMGTAKKNIKWHGEDAQEIMMKSIKSGSKGKYGNFKHTQMPAYSHISNKDLETITSWILKEYSKNKILKSQGKL